MLKTRDFKVNYN